MGAIKKWMHEVHDDCLKIGVVNTAKKYDISTEEVKTVTMNHVGWKKAWNQFLVAIDMKNTMRNLNETAKTLTKKKGS